MEFDKLYEKHLEPMLKEILNERVQYNKNYNRVDLYLERGELIIKWSGLRNGGLDGWNKRALPFNFKHVSEEIDRQYYKLRNNR